MKLSLRPFTAEEFQAWKGPNREQYAREKEKEGLTKEDARAEAERSFATLLPQQEKTPDQYLYSVVEQASGSVVGDLWWAKRQYGTRQRNKRPRSPCIRPQ